MNYDIEDEDYSKPYHQFRDFLTKKDLSGETLQQIVGIYFDENRTNLAQPLLIQKSHTVADSFGFMLSGSSVYYSTVGYGLVQRNMFYPVTLIPINENVVDMCKVGDDLGIFTQEGLKIIRIDNVESTPVFSFKRKLPHIKRSNIEVFGDSIIFASNHGLFIMDGYELQNIGEAIYDKIKAADALLVHYNDIYQMVYLFITTSGSGELWQYHLKHKAWSKMTFPKKLIKFYQGSKPVVLVSETVDDEEVYTTAEVNYTAGDGKVVFHPFDFGDMENFKRLYYLLVDKESVNYEAEVQADPLHDPPIEYKAMEGMKITANGKVIGPTSTGYKFFFPVTQPISKTLELTIEGKFKLKRFEVEYDFAHNYKGAL